MRRLSHLLAATASLLFAATCVEVRLVPGEGGTGGAGGMATTTTTTTTGGTGGSGGVGGGPSCGCERLDMLLVVDNSNSIDGVLSNVAALGASLVPLISSLQQVACDFHIGVVTSMPQTLNPPGCQQLGALSTANASGEDCFFDVDRNYATGEDVPLLERLLCMIQTGRQGTDDERLMDALRIAVTDEALNAPQGCNEGFLRADAPLVVVLVSDIDDTQSANAPTPGFWYLQLLAEKGDDPDKVVSIGLIPERVSTCPEAQGADNLRDFLDAHPMGRAIATDVCSPMASDLEEPANTMLQAICPIQ